jgi:quinol monooxygenase YgiN
VSAAEAAGPVTTLASVTRFRLRSLRFAPFFMLHANRTIAQIRKADGFVAGAVRRDADLAFWTLTVWRDEAAMRAYGASGAHRKAVPHLAEWGDEACVAHWTQPGTALPEWPEAVRRLREDGRAVTLRYPAPAHAGRSFAEPRMTHGMGL